MSRFDLEKKAEIIDRFLLTKGIKQAPTMRVAAALDISGSMSGHIAAGDLQNALNQLMGAAMRFDDNGELDVFKFDDRCEYVGTCTPDDYTDYVKRNRISARGGTNYAPIITEAKNFFFEGTAAQPAKKGFFGFGKKEAVAATVDNTPVLMLVLTDGEPWDADSLEHAFSSTQNENIYYHLVGIGGTRGKFPTIARLADKLDNVGEVYLPRFDMSDDEVYEQLISDELVEFVGKFTPVS